MASPGAGDSQYFFTWTLVDDSAGAKTIHFITASLIGEPWPESLLSLKVDLMECDVESGDGRLLNFFFKVYFYSMLQLALKCLNALQ